MAKVSERSIDEYAQDPENANVGTASGRDLVAHSFKKLKAGRSGLADADGVMIAGNKSLVAAKAAGIATVIEVETTGEEYVIVKRTDLVPGDPLRDELALVDNRTTEIGLKWDPSKIREKWGKGVDFSRLWPKAQLEELFNLAKEQTAAQSLDDVSEELPGAQALKPYMVFPSENPWEIPDLLPDMLAECPEPIDVWAGQDASDLEWEGAWLYCYGSDSMRGLDVDRAVLAFYVDDYRFESWFAEPDKYVAKAINAGFRIAITHNFSLWKEEPLAVHLHQIYKSRWLGRYMQEAGIFVIPDVEWSRPEDFEFCFLGVPIGAPCISTQVQTITPGTEQRIANDIGQMLTALKPKTILLYGGGKETRYIVSGAIPDHIRPIWITSRVNRRRDKVMPK